MVFAAGLGTRMRPVTDTLPKPLVAIGGRTMLDHMLDRLAEADVGTAVVNVHHLADQIVDRLRDRRRPAIILSDERQRLLDQAGGIRRALPHLGPRPFMICNTDAIWTEAEPPNLSRLAGDWESDRMDVLLLVAATATSVGIDWPGDFFLEADGRLARRGDAASAPFAYAGVGIVKPELFTHLEERPARLAPFFFAAAERGRLFGTRFEGTWMHVGTPAAIADAEAAFARETR